MRQRTAPSMMRTRVRIRVSLGHEEEEGYDGEADETDEQALTRLQRGTGNVANNASPKETQGGDQDRRHMLAGGTGHVLDGGAETEP